MMVFNKWLAGQTVERVVVQAFRALLLTCAPLLLTACGESLSPSQDAERVRIVLYHPLPKADAMKLVGDWAMLNTGELVQIQARPWLVSIGWSGPALPVPETLIELDRRNWYEQSEQRKGKGEIEASLDRGAGLLCVVGQCKPIHAVCRPLETGQKRGLNCRTYTVN